MNIATLVICLSLLAATPSFASGLGWYVGAVSWKYLDEEMRGLVDESNDLLAEAPKSPKLREFFQERLDSEIWSMCAGRKRHFRDLSPYENEFYSLRTIAYAQALQRKAGRKESFFHLFGRNPPYYRIRRYAESEKRKDLAFVVPPDHLEKWYAEVFAFNKDNHHPVEHKASLEHLEAVLLLAKSDGEFDPGLPADIRAKYRTALIFCAHD